MALKLDELDIYGLKRCRNCSGKLIRTTTQRELRKHVGHLLSPPADVHVWEYIRIKLGLL